MKKLTLYIFILVSLISTSCSDFLKEEPKNSIPLDGFLNSELKIDAALYSMYKPLMSGGLFGHYLPVIEVGTDLYTTRKTLAVGDFFREFTITSESPWINSISYGTWDKLWQGVLRCNLIINGIDNAAVSDDYRTAAIAEARCMRAFYYYYLVRLWGDLPIITWYTSSDEFEATADMPRSSADNVYNTVIVPDLVEAAESAPKEYAFKGRATKWFARTLLAEVYMTMAGYRRDAVTGVIDNGDPIYWSKALEMIKSVVDPATFSAQSGCPHYLLDNYGDNWDKDFSNEAIFEVGATNLSGAGSALAQEILGALSGAGFWASNENYFDLTRVPSGVDYNNPISYIDPYVDSSGEAIPYFYYHQFPTGARANGLFTPTAELFHRFEKGDIRKSWGMATSYKASDRVYYFHPAFRKYLDFELLTGQTGTDWNYANINFVVYRYADALMILAEAENEVNGATPTAHGAINEIRRRAGLSELTGLSQSTMREAIQQERSVEFHAEVKHRFDLIRWNTFREATKSYDHYYTAGENAATPIEGVEDDNPNPNYVENSTLPSQRLKSYIKSENTEVYADIKDWVTTGCETATQAPYYFYLLPIPQSELDKTNWKQNKGYN